MYFSFYLINFICYSNLSFFNMSANVCWSSSCCRMGSRCCTSRGFLATARTLSRPGRTATSHGYLNVFWSSGVALESVMHQMSENNCWYGVYKTRRSPLLSVNVLARNRVLLGGLQRDMVFYLRWKMIGQR